MTLRLGIMDAMFPLVATAKIKAPPALVYDVIVDLARYAEWNPWIVGARGTPRAHGPLVEVDAKLGGKVQTVQHRVLVTEPGRAFEWEDVGFFTLFAKGNRARTLTANADGGTDYRMVLDIRGAFTFLVKALYGRALETGVREETAALVARAEALHAKRS